MKQNVSGAGAVLPPGSLPAAPLPEGKLAVRIDGFDDSGLVRCVYPGGFVKHHQADGVEALAVQVVNQIRGRHGLTEVKLAAVPKAVEPGQSFTVEV
jgi:hypothetical protein